MFAATSAISLALLAATAGLPFTEEFNDTLLRDTPRTSANWNTSQGVLSMQRRRPLQNVIDSAAAGVAIGNKSVSALSIALGDLDGDGDLDLVLVGGSDDRYFLNNGSSTPFTSSTPFVAFSNSNSKSGQVALEDFDRDGDLDLAGVLGINGVKSALATALFRDGNLSLARAARLAGLTLGEFVAHVSRLGIVGVDLDADDANRDMDTLESWLGSS